MFLLRLFLLFFCFFMGLQQAWSWGFWAHQRINRLAVFTLPPEMLILYKRHIDFLTDHAVDPDKRRYAVEGEAAHHYIDVDHYDIFPFEEVPREWEDAVSKYTADTLEAYGVLPYHLPTVVLRLKKAFERGDLRQIMKLSSDLGHYVGDAHVPLHTTKNYNGQLSGQKGIHGFWESRLPELFATQYDFFVGRAYFIEDVLMEGWEAVLESHAAKDSVLFFERDLSRDFPADKKYGYESRNQTVVRTYSRTYSAAYHKMLDGMVERRMCKAIRRIGAYWYTAWKMAGAPDLHPLLLQNIEDSQENFERKFKIIDRESSDIGSIGPIESEHLCCMRPGHDIRYFGNPHLKTPPKKALTWWQKVWLWLKSSC